MIWWEAVDVSRYYVRCDLHIMTGGVTQSGGGRNDPAANIYDSIKLAADAMFSSSSIIGWEQERYV